MRLRQRGHDFSLPSWQPFNMNLTKDILLIAHYSVMFDECRKFMFLVRHVSSVHLLYFA